MSLGFLGLFSAGKRILSKVPWWVYVVGMFLVVVGIYVKSIQNERDRAKDALVELLVAHDATTRLNDSLVVRVAHDELIKDSLTGSLDLANKLNARLIAAAKISIIPDTVYVAETPSIRETVDSVGVRTALFNDTSRVGILSAIVTIPPIPQPVTLDYTFRFKPIQLEIGLVETAKDHLVFGVTYTGGQTEVSVPYARLPDRRPHIIGYVEGGYLPFNDKAAFGRLGVSWRPFLGLYLFTEVEQTFNVDGFTKSLEFDRNLTTGRFGLGIRLFER